MNEAVRERKGKGGNVVVGSSKKEAHFFWKS
jgi:hypothetical protein